MNTLFFFDATSSFVPQFIPTYIKAAGSWMRLADLLMSILSQSAGSML